MLKVITSVFESIKKLIATVVNYAVMILIGIVVVVLAIYFMADIFISRYEDVHGHVNRVELILRLFNRHRANQVIAHKLSDLQRENLHKSRYDFIEYVNSKNFGEVFDLIPTFRVNYLIKNDSADMTISELRQFYIDSVYNVSDYYNYHINSSDIKHFYRAYFEGDTIFVLSYDTTIYIDERTDDTLYSEEYELNVSYNAGNKWYFTPSGYPDIRKLNETITSLNAEFNPAVADSLFSWVKIK